jgi:hypothetical protein
MRDEGGLMTDEEIQAAFEQPETSLSPKLHMCLDVFAGNAFAG